MSTTSSFFSTLSPSFRSPEAEFELFNCQAPENLDAIEALLTGKAGTSIGILQGDLGIGRSYAVRSVLHRLGKKGQQLTYLPVDLSTWNGGEDDRLERYATALIEKHKERGRAVRNEIFDMVRTLTLAAASMSPAVLAIAVLLEAQHRWKIFRAFFNEYGDGFRADPFHALAELLARLAGEGGAVLHIDPLEGLPDTDLVELCAIAERVDGLTVLFSSSRADDVEDRFRLARHAPREIRFQPHETTSAGAVLDRCFQPNDFPPELNQRLYEYSGGHPRILANKLFELVDQEAVLLDDQGRWRVAEEGMENKGVVGAFADHFWQDLRKVLAECPVPRQVQEVLARAAICGRYLPLGLITASLGLMEEAEEEVIDFIDDQLTVGEAFPILEDLGFRHPSFPGQSVYRFVDPFLREAILWNLGDAETSGRAAELLRFLERTLEKPMKGAALIFVEIARFLEGGPEFDALQDLRWWIDREMAPSLTRQIQRDLQDGRTDAATLWIAAKEASTRWPTFRVIALLNALEGSVPQTELGNYHSLRGHLYFANGQYQNALQDAEEALSFYSAELSPDHPSILTARGQLALYTGAVGRKREALLLSEALILDQERVLGVDHHNTLTTRGNVARWTGEMGDSRKALFLFEALLPDVAQVLGADHPTSLTTRANIAHWTGEAGDSRKALQILQPLLADRVRVLGPDHTETLITRSNIAFWTSEVDDRHGALSLYERLRLDQEVVLGPDHPEVLTTRGNIARLVGQNGDALRALSLSEDLLRDQQRLLGVRHPETWQTQCQVAFWTAAVGEKDRALLLFEEALSGLQRVLGADHPVTLITRSNIAFWTSELGETRKAVALFRALMPDLERVLGADHPDTLGTAKKIEELKGQL